MHVIGWLVWPESRRRRSVEPMAEIARWLLARLSRPRGLVSVSPVSAEWLAEHEAVSSKHQAEGNTS